MLDQAVRAAAAPLHVPGQVDWRVISPAQVEAIAAEHSLPRWQVEVAALEAEIVPLPYMRNLARFSIRGQLELLRTAVTVVGSGLPVRKCLQILAAHGIGRLRVLTPSETPDARRQTPGKAAPGGDPGGASPMDAPSALSEPSRLAPGVWRLSSPQALAAEVTNQNASLQ